MTATIYLLNYKGGDKTGIKTFLSPAPLLVGQCIQLPETGEWYLVLATRSGPKGVTATVSVPAESLREAVAEATRYRHWKSTTLLQHCVK
ncbi:hypothetical protein [Limnohabitans sp.]|jgi:hypothetical protein|uniref:hypothetical protein n=1 Tax=Limnohabitans sp. TaxID=1907725 RepID=UPI0037C12467